MSQAISDLLNDHEAISSALLILERMNADMEEKNEVATSDMIDFIAFLREFADKCHHGKEEDFLFPALLAADPKMGGIVGLLLREHTNARQLVEEMAKSIQGTADSKRLLKATKGYTVLLHNHIQKENGILFPTAEDALSQEKLAEIFKGFEAYEENIIGHGRHEQLHAILGKLEIKYRI